MRAKLKKEPNEYVVVGNLNKYYALDRNLFLGLRVIYHHYTHYAHPEDARVLVDRVSAIIVKEMEKL